MSNKLRFATIFVLFIIFIFSIAACTKTNSDIGTNTSLSSLQSTTSILSNEGSSSNEGESNSGSNNLSDSSSQSLLSSSSQSSLDNQVNSSSDSGGYPQATGGLFYELIDNGNAYQVSKGSIEGVSSIVIAKEYNGKPVTTVSYEAFRNCSSLISITIPSGIINIGDFAFAGCISLTDISIPSGVTGIGDRAFTLCSSLTSIEISSTVTSIGSEVFRYCSSLENIIIPKSVTSIGGYAFNNTGIWNKTENNSVVYADKWLVGYKGVLTNIVLSNGTIGISDSALSGCSSLKSVIMANSLISINSGAFRNCISLTSITIPESVNSIGSYAFNGCNSLTIYAEAISKFSGGEPDWNYSSRPVVWGCILSVDKSYVMSFAKSIDSIFYPSAINGIKAPYRHGYAFEGWAVSLGSTTSVYTAKDISSAADGESLYAVWIKE